MVLEVGKFKSVMPSCGEGVRASSSPAERWKIKSR